MQMELFILVIYLRDALKKVHMEGNCPNLSLPPPPSKLGEKMKKKNKLKSREMNEV